jgi:hypothetical protein
MSTRAMTLSRPIDQARTLGACWVVYGVARLMAAVWLAIFSGTATVMFGALLTRVPDPFTLMTTFHFVYLGIIALSVACGIVGIMAGLALMSGAGSARMLAVIAALLSVSEIPVGTTLGIYTLVEVFPRS